MIFFHHNQWMFKLTTPEYETEIFGGKMGELRLIKTLDKLKEGDISLSMSFFPDFMLQRGILACTFRGQENTNLVQYLNGIGFKFIGTFMSMKCENLCQDYLKPFKAPNNYSWEEASEKDYNRILEIESKVFDYSSFQIDKRFPNEITSYRNVLRVKSYFNHQNHHIYIVKDNNKIVGFIQAIVDKENHKVELVNGGLDPDYHGKGVGTKLYNLTFNMFFSVMGINIITTNFCVQNIPVLKIKQAYGFTLTGTEIHLRLKL